jgi:hypothetical protein
VDLIFKTWSQILSIFFICKIKKVVIFRLSVESLLWYSLPKKTILNRLAKYDTYSIVMCYQDLLRLFDRHLKSLDKNCGFLVQYQNKVLIPVKFPENYYYLNYPNWDFWAYFLVSIVSTKVLVLIEKYQLSMSRAIFSYFLKPKSRNCSQFKSW